jgi:hypothetical protein
MRQSIIVKSFIILVAGMAVVGGVVFLGLRASPEVRGEITPTISPSLDSSPGGGEAATYLRDLRADDYTTYTHPVYGFSFAYPRAFEFFTTQTVGLDETSVYHPRLPLGINVYVRPLEGNEDSEKLVAYLTSLPAEYDADPPEGADGGAAALAAQDDPYPGQYTRYFWFAHQDHLYEIQLHAPDRELLELWAQAFVYSDFTLTRPAHDS